MSNQDVVLRDALGTYPHEFSFTTPLGVYRAWHSEFTVPASDAVAYLKSRLVAADAAELRIFLGDSALPEFSRFAGVIRTRDAFPVVAIAHMPTELIADFAGTGTGATDLAAEAAKLLDYAKGMSGLSGAALDRLHELRDAAQGVVRPPPETIRETLKEIQAIAPFWVVLANSRFIYALMKALPTPRGAGQIVTLLREQALSQWEPGLEDAELEDIVRANGEFGLLWE